MAKRATWHPLGDEEMPQPGDLALHLSNDLDARPVTRVEGGQIWLALGKSEIGPFHLFAYSYQRKSAAA